MVEELVFRKAMLYSLKDICDKNDDVCHDTLDAKIKLCMAENDWQSFLNEPEDDEESKQFTQRFLGCLDLPSMHSDSEPERLDQIPKAKNSASGV